MMVLSFVFRTVWSLFTSWRIPGTHTTPAGWALFALSALLAIRIAKMFLDLPNDSDVSK